MDDASLEISSGKDTAYENFPVGSWLLPSALRPHIATFYHFARAADDIADAPNLSPEEKIARLNQFEEAVTGKRVDETAPPKALQMATSLTETHITSQHCIDLLAAFKQDAVKPRYANWQELIDYCQLSAAPVGRYLIDLHGGFLGDFRSSAGAGNDYGPSDALCAALQILNHLQDCQDDFQTLDRVYLPADMLVRHQVKIEDLAAPAITQELRQCLNEILDGVEALMEDAASLPQGLKSTRLAMESQAIINIANQLSKKLRKNDPIKTRVKLSKLEYIGCCILGVPKSLIR
jgi:squalene synthase HpnC